MKNVGDVHNNIVVRFLLVNLVYLSTISLMTVLLGYLLLYIIVTLLLEYIYIVLY